MDSDDNLLLGLTGRRRRSGFGLSPAKTLLVHAADMRADGKHTLVLDAGRRGLGPHELLRPHQATTTCRWSPPVINHWARSSRTRWAPGRQHAGLCTNFARNAAFCREVRNRRNCWSSRWGGRARRTPIPWGSCTTGRGPEFRGLPDDESRCSPRMYAPRPAAVPYLKLRGLLQHLPMFITPSSPRIPSDPPATLLPETIAHGVGRPVQSEEDWAALEAYRNTAADGVRLDGIPPDTCCRAMRSTASSTARPSRP